MPPHRRKTTVIGFVPYGRTIRRARQTQIGASSNINLDQTRPLTLQDLPEDVLCLIMNELDPFPFSCEYYPPRPFESPLLSLRIVNKYFSVLTASRVFNIVVVGKTNLVLDCVPSQVLRCMRYLCIYPNTEHIAPLVWLQLAAANVVGVRYEGYFWRPIDTDLGKFCLLASVPITTLSIKFSACILTARDFSAFEAVMSKLSVTITSLSLDMTHYQDTGVAALYFIQQHFKKLISIQFLYLDAVSAIWGLSGDWACLPALSKLVVYQSSLSFSTITDFLLIAPMIHTLVVENCFPWDARNGAASLRLQRYRVFSHLDIQATYPAILGSNPVYVVRS